MLVSQLSIVISLGAGWVLSPFPLHSLWFLLTTLLVTHQYNPAPISLHYKIGPSTFSPKGGGNIFLRNVDINLQHFMVSTSKRLQFECEDMLMICLCKKLHKYKVSKGVP